MSLRDRRVRTTRISTSDGVCLVADVGGDRSAPTIVLLHGGGQTRHSWAGTVHWLLDAGYRVINYDARGHGESEWSSSGDYSLLRRAQDLREVLDCPPQDVAFVGASLGGATAMRAIADGLRPAALVLVDIVPRPDPKGVERIRSFMLGHSGGFATLQDAARAVAAFNPHRAQPNDVGGLAKNLREGADGRLHWHWDPKILEPSVETEITEFQRTVAGLRSAGDVPIALVRGRESDVVSEEAVAEFKQHLPSLEILEVAGAGHMVAGDKNDIFSLRVIEFLARHVPPGIDRK